MEMKINFIFICCIIITIMFVSGVILATIDTIKKSKTANYGCLENEDIEDLLIEFDEMSFIPGTTCPNPEEYAKDYKQRLIKTIENNNNKYYLCYVLIDYDVTKKEYVLEIYDFRDHYFKIINFNNYSDMVNYYHDELKDFLKVEDKDILQINSITYRKKLGVKGYEYLDGEYIKEQLL